MINNYKDLTLEKYLQLRDIDITELEPLDIQAQMIAILSDMTEDEVLDLSLPEYQRLVGEMLFLNEEPVPIKTIPKELTIGGRKYSVLKNAREMTAGQFIDYQSYIKDDVEKKLPLLLTCFIIPKGKKYGQYDIAEVIDDMRMLPIETVLGLAAFFLRQSQRLISNTLTYLDWSVRRMERKEKKTETREKMKEAREKIRLLQDLVNDGDGLA